MKKQFNIRMSGETLATINTLASSLECSQADVVRQAVRLLARREAWCAQAGGGRPGLGPPQKKLPKK